MSQFMPDCLVLKLEEVERDTNNIDTILYIIYDKKNNNYLIRGERKSTAKSQSCNYSFNCDCKKYFIPGIQYPLNFLRKTPHFVYRKT